MTVDVFTLYCPSLPTAELVGFRGTEYMSRPYQFDIFFTVPLGANVRAAVNPPNAVRDTATLMFDRGDGTPPMAWHGVFVRLRLLRQVHERVLYCGTLVPRLWLLRYSFRSHVFTDTKIKQFLTETLEHGGLAGDEFRFAIDDGRYPTEEFVCQYRESHLDFFHRWLEREGLYYFFEHEPREGGKEVLVIVDDKNLHEPLSGTGRVRYYPAAPGDVASGDHLRELFCDFEGLPANVLITDYNYERPTTPVQGEHAVQATGQGELRDYGYRVFTAPEADRLATVKAQSLSCRELTVRASGNASGLRAGYLLELWDQPEDVPSGQLVIEARHSGSLSSSSEEVARYTGLGSKETYGIDLVSIPAATQFRAAQTTPWPRIDGFENAVVDGEKTSDYAQIDDQGRYHVRFKFDSSTLQPGKASCWLRMAQPHGGEPEGWHFPLRKHTEVMVAFRGGDPDRPVISGVVPHPLTPSTVTSKNSTFNVLRTGGRSHLEIEDQDGKQHLQLYTPTAETELFMGGPKPEQSFGDPKTGGQMTVKDLTFYVSTDQSAGFKVGGEWWQDVVKDINIKTETGNVTLHSPKEIKFTAPKVTIDTSTWGDTYFMNFNTGVFKTDIVASKVLATGVKFEVAGIEQKNNAVFTKNSMVNTRNEVVAILKGAVRLFSFGFLKI